MLFSSYSVIEAKLGQQKGISISIQNPVKVSQLGKDPPASEGVGFFWKILTVSIKQEKIAYQDICMTWHNEFITL